MTPRLTLLSLLLVVPSVLAEASSATVQPPVQAFTDAWAKGDVATAEKLLHPDYKHVDVAGKALDRATYVETMKTRSVAKYTSAFDEIETRVEGELAIVTGLQSFWPATRDPKHFKQQMRFVQIWLKTPDGWRRLYFQATPVR